MSFDFVNYNGVWKHCSKPCDTAPLQKTSGEIPLIIAEEAYKEYAAQFGREQSLEQLNNRGGFGSDELAILLYDRIKRIEKSEITNPFCDNCKEKDCLISLDGTCAMIRIYFKNKNSKELEG